MKKTNYPYIIAEIGCNHNGSIELAKEMISKAFECGCDAVKFQLWQKEELLTSKYMNELNIGTVKIENIDKWETKELGLKDINEQVDKFVLSYQSHIELFSYCRSLGIDYTTTPITNEGVDFVVEQGCQFIKISSMDVNNLELIKYAINTGLPIVISLGLASLSEIEDIINIIPKGYEDNVTLLHCTSLYPPKDEQINLNFIKTVKDIFGVKVGYSDHSLGFSIPLASIVLGATMIEKHFTLDKDMPGWDHKVSANPDEMKIICKETKKIYNSLGTGKKELSVEEYEKRKKFRRSLVTASDYKKGHVISENDVVFKRPGTGIAPNEIKYVIGRRLNKDLSNDELINWGDLL